MQYAYMANFKVNPPSVEPGIFIRSIQNPTLEFRQIILLSFTNRIHNHFSCFILCIPQLRMDKATVKVKGTPAVPFEGFTPSLNLGL